MKLISLRKLTLTSIIPALFMLSLHPANAAGMIPETSVVIVQESDGEASINVTNSDSHPALLFSSIQNLESDDEDLLILTPPVARLEAGESQSIRFLLQSKKPLDVQRLLRVTFEGIVPKKPTTGVKIGMNVRQNLPVIVNPKGLAKDPSPWLRLQWSLQGGKLVANNPSAYVVRLAQNINLLPSNTLVRLPQLYVLPGQKMSLDVPSDVVSNTTAVRLYPATMYGYAVDSYDAPLTK